MEPKNYHIVINNDKASFKINKLYDVLCQAKELQNWFFDNGKKITKEQREQIIKVSNNLEETALIVYKLKQSIK